MAVLATRIESMAAKSAAQSWVERIRRQYWVLGWCC
jgi:hypothetical protein